MSAACSSAKYYNLAMLQTILVASMLLFAQHPAAQTGVIAGTVTVPADHPLSQPLQVILLSPRYADLWDTDVQKRLDMYWERYKPAFAQNKEYFLEISRKAQIESLDYVVARMRRDVTGNIGDYVKQATADGKFEFKAVPFGAYKLFAIGKAQNTDLLWQESVDVHTALPQFLELKKPLP
jgi:hypothetical protein